MKLEYSIEINAPAEKIWKLMIGKDTYNEWAKGFSEGSLFEGTWAEGETILFVDPGVGGTKGRLDEFKPFETMTFTHVGTVDKDRNDATPDEMGKKWIGSTEKYFFEEKEGTTLLRIEMETDEAFKEMFDVSWPKALGLLKELCDDKYGGLQ